MTMSEERKVFLRVSLSVTAVTLIMALGLLL